MTFTAKIPLITIRRNKSNELQKVWENEKVRYLWHFEVTFLHRTIIETLLQTKTVSKNRRTIVMSSLVMSNIAFGLCFFK